MAIMWHKKTTVDLIFEFGISQNAKCDNFISSPKSSHICSYACIPFIYKIKTLKLLWLKYIAILAKGGIKCCRYARECYICACIHVFVHVLQLIDLHTAVATV